MFSTQSSLWSIRFLKWYVTCGRSLWRMSRPVIPRVANGSPPNARPIESRRSVCLARFRKENISAQTRSERLVEPPAPRRSLTRAGPSCFGSPPCWGSLSLRSLAGFGRGRQARGGSAAPGPERWWSSSRPAWEANWVPWATRYSRRHPADTRKASGCSPPSLWLCCRRRKTACWTWKRWARSRASLCCWLAHVIWSLVCLACLAACR